MRLQSPDHDPTHSQRRRRWTVSALLTLALLAAASWGQAPVLAGLDGPLKIAVTPGGNTLVVQSGTGVDDGRVTLVSNFGERWNLLDGLPSVALGEGVSGPTGVADQHATLYVLIGEGDVLGPSTPPTQLPNPEGWSSAIFSSILRATFTPVPDGIREGFILTEEHEAALADGRVVSLTNESGERVELDILADFRNLSPDPFVGMRQSNPFDVELFGSLTTDDLVELGLDHLSLSQANFLARTQPDSSAGERLRDRTHLYVADAGMNTVLKVAAHTGRTSVLTRLPPVANPLFPMVGGPVSDPVPTAVSMGSDGLYVSTLVGFPFVPGTASIWRVDPQTGAFAPAISGLTSVTDILLTDDGAYVTQLSTDFLAGSPGQLLFYSSEGGEPTVVAPALIGPTGIAYNERQGRVIVSETFTGLLRGYDR